MASWNDRTVTNEHLLPYVDSNTAEPAVQASLRTLPFERNIFKLIANSTTFFPDSMKLLTDAWSPKRSLRTKDWQLIVLRTATVLDAPYEWDVNETTGRIFGFTDIHLENIRKGDLSSVELFTDRQRLIVKIVDQLATQPRVQEDLVLEAKRVLGDEALMDLFFTQSIYAFLARTMNSCKIDFDEPIPGLEEKLRQYNAATIEKEKQYTD